MTSEREPCFICKEPIETDLQLAVIFERGIRRTEPVHRDCLDHHCRKLAHEAWLNSPALRKAAHAQGFTFRSWYDAGTPKVMSLE